MSARVDVLLPVRNGGRLLHRAVDSVLAQEGVDVRIVLVDDASTDGAVTRLRRDPRIHVVAGPGRGIAAALNAGLADCRAAYVARQDADDESLPGRLVAQVAHLDAHPGIGIVGTAFEVLIGRRVVGVVSPHPAGLLEANRFCHGSVMMRRALVQTLGGYRSIMAEDYDLWLRAAALSGVSILAQSGYRYRLSAGMSTVRNKSQQVAYGQLVRASARARLAGLPDPMDTAEPLPGDPAQDLEVAAWWAHEFAALGAWADALACLRRLPARRAARVVAGLLPLPRPQVMWS
ncbi:MAG: glycosyltransferase family 2 protein [Mycobacteriales bacterium]